MPNSIFSKNFLVIVLTTGSVGTLFRYKIFPEMHNYPTSYSNMKRVNEVALKYPENGSITRYSKVSSKEILAQCEVVTDAEQKDRNYFIKMVDWSNDKTILTFLERSRQIASMIRF